MSGRYVVITELFHHGSKIDANLNFPLMLMYVVAMHSSRHEIEYCMSLVILLTLPNPSTTLIYEIYPLIKHLDSSVQTLQCWIYITHVYMYTCIV